MTLSQVIVALTVIQTKMSDNGLSLDYNCVFYADSEKYPIYLSLNENTVLNILENPNNHISDNGKYFVIPLEDAIHGERL